MAQPSGGKIERRLPVPLFNGGDTARYLREGATTACLASRAEWLAYNEQKAFVEND